MGSHLTRPVYIGGAVIEPSATNVIAGDVKWVDSGNTNGSDNTSSGDFDTPYATLDYAIGQCTASNGDHIFIAPGHTETISAAGSVTVDVAGLTIIGCGRGSDRPTFNFTATASTIVISSANAYIENILCTGGIDAVVTMFSITGADCALIDVETKDVTGQMTSCITTAATAHRLALIRPIHRGAAGAGGANWAEIVGGDGLIIEDAWVDGNFSSACIQNVTTAMTNATIYGDKGSFFRTRNAADVAITCVNTSTGNLGPNIYIRVQDDAANVTEAVAGADMQWFQPISICNADGEVGLNTNQTPTVDEA